MVALADSEGRKSPALLVVLFNFRNWLSYLSCCGPLPRCKPRDLQIPNGIGRGDVLAANRGIP
jgi:hypothetical protein